MLKNKSIAIISANTFVAIGLRELLNNYFSPRVVEIYSEADLFLKSDSTQNCEFIFLVPEIYVSHIDAFQTFKNQLVFLTTQNNPGNTSFPILNCNLSEEELVTDIEKIFKSTGRTYNIESTEELSNREIDVLKLVSLGKMNKQIADQLNISMHTVISHRKNITRKLGIKTVSGLTVYALMNGIIGSTDIE